MPKGVYSRGSLRSRFEEKYVPEPNTGCFLWTASTNKKGYGFISLGPKLNKKNYSSHRISWMIYRGKITGDLCVLHKCDMPSCVNPNHLFLGTILENNRDRENKNRGRGWANLPKPKLSASNVRSILSDERPLSEIAKEYGVTYRNIYSIKKRESWSHI